MMDMHMQYVMDKMNEIWKVFVRIFEEEKISGQDCANIMLTVTARYLNACSSLPTEQRELIKKEYIDLLNKKLG